MQIKKIMLALIAAAGLCAASAQADNLVVNGDFEQSTNGAGQFDFNTQLTGWSSSGYNFLFASGTADTTGSNGSYGGLSMWGSNNGGNDVLTDSPTGGNFIAADGAFQVAPITQTINGLNVGQQYDVSFYWAAAQQKNFDGATTEQWSVSLGNETHSTAVYNNPSHSFSGWMQQTFTFTATSGSEVLAFLATGTPNGTPPFSLLDGVTMAAAVPEPSSWGMALVGLGLIGLVARRRRPAFTA